MAEKPELLTLKEAAAVLRVSRTTIHEYVHRKFSKGGNKIPIVRVGRGTIRIPREKFYRWAGLID